MSANIVILAFLHCCYALQILAAAAFAFSFLPSPPTEFAARVFPAWRVTLQINNDLLLFRIFALSALAMQLAGMIVYRKRLGSAELTRSLKPVCLWEAGWSALAVVCGLAVVSDPQAVLPKVLLAAVFILTVLFKVWRPQVMALCAPAAGQAGRAVKAVADRTRHWVRAHPLPPQLKTFLIVDGILTAMLAQAVFKVLANPQRPQLAQYACAVLGALWLLHKIFFPEVDRFLKRSCNWLLDPANTARWGRWPDAVLPALFALLIFVPDYEAALARMFLGEQFHHTEAFMMCSGWAHVSGSLLNVDVTSRYGMGAPILLSEIARRLPGGFGYESMFLVVMFGCMLYFVLWYFLLRRWFNSVAWAFIGTVLAVKWQMFHTEVFPFPYTYPNATPIRCFWDVVAAWCIFQHVRTHRRVWLIAAGTVCGLAIFYTLGDGLYLTLGFYGYLAAHTLTPEARAHVFFKRWGWRALGVYAAVPFLAAFLFVVMAVGKHAFTADFWNNLTAFMDFYKGGLGAGSLANAWKNGPFEFLTGGVLASSYVLTAGIVAGLIFCGRMAYRNIFVVFLAGYGLAAFHYYVMLANNTGYYRNGVLAAFLVCFWAAHLLRGLPYAQLRRAQLALAALCVYALVTHHNFISFPNIFNVSRNPMIDPLVAEVPASRTGYFNHLFTGYPDRFKLARNSVGETDEMLVTEKDFKSHKELKEFYRREFDYTKDAKLIRELIPPQGRVPLISSFETKILMQAGRRPFFYIFELVNSRPRRMRIFVVTHLYTFDNLQRTIDQLEKEKPPYVFLERIFLTPEFPQAYVYDSQDLVMLLSYVLQHYEVYKNGEFLAALKRKP